MIVVPHIPPQVRTEDFYGVEVPPVNNIGLERVEERLHMGVFIGRAPAGHALSDAVLRQDVTERASEELATAIAMEDQANARLAPLESCLDSPPRQP